MSVRLPLRVLRGWLAVVVLGWLVIETQGGSDLGLAERLSVSTETCWPFVVALALRQTTRPYPDPGRPVIAAIRSRRNQQAAGGGLAAKERTPNGRW